MFTRRTALALTAAAPLSVAAAQAKPSYPFEYWDVFTDRPFTGNPLAVFTNAAGLSPDQMRAIAAETNLSETTFLFRRPAAEEKTKGVRTRIFTPTTEYDFAGHPALGTAFALWRPGMTRVTLDLNVGPVPIDLKFEGGKLYGTMTQPQPVFAETHEPAKIAKLIGLPITDIDTTHPIQSVSTGRPNLIVMLTSLKAIQALKIDWSAAKDLAFYFLTPETESGANYHARKLTPRTEDPVTGSAAGCAIAWLVSQKLVESGRTITIEQGREVNRPGRLYVSADVNGAQVSNVKVGGYGVRTWTGQLPGMF